MYYRTNKQLFCGCLETVAQNCSIKKGFLKNFVNSQKNTYVRVSFSIKLQTLGLSQNSQQNTCVRVSFLSYRNQSIDLLCKSMDWFLYNSGLRLEKVKKLSYRILIELFMYHESTLLIKHKLINLN